MMNKTILFIDDDERILELLKDYFAKNSYDTFTAFTGREGIGLLTSEGEAIDIVVLDLMLPEMDGFETLREIRTFSDIPVIMLTAKDDETDRIVGLEMGADDYLHKPFNPRELLARIKVVLRRVQRQPSTVSPGESDEIQSMGLVMSPQSRRASINGEEINLSTVEFDILMALVNASGRVISRDRLLNLARGREFEAFDRSIDVHISRIRKKIEEDPSTPKRLKTIWGKGYMWCGD